MGLLTKTLRVAHPVRSAKRSVKRAVTPRPIRRALRVKNTITHPIGSLEYKAIGSVDRAITPRSRKRNRGAGGGVILLVAVAVGLTVAFPIVMLPIWGLTAVIAILYGIGRRQQHKQAAMTDAKQQLYRTTIKLQGAVDAALAATPSETQRQGITGWWVELGRNYERLMADDESAAADYHQSVDRLTQWVSWKPATCTHCGAPDQTAGQPCRYCAKTA